MDLLAEVKRYISYHGLLNRDFRVVVGVSGGPDSVVLLHLLTRLAKSWRLHLHVAHLHHGIREGDADIDAKFVADLAERWACSYKIEWVNIPATARTAASSGHRISRDSDHVSDIAPALEETARRVRYAFLLREAQQHRADCIAVGHNANDQAETVLMNLLRGAGPAGLRGMLPLASVPLHQTETRSLTAMPLIRPLLATSREDIEAYCEAYDLKPRLDRSNLDTAYFRNQLRHQVLPYLEGVRPGISERLNDLAEIIRADYELLEEFAQVAWDTLLTDTYPDALTFNLEGWRAQPLSVRRALIRRAAYEIRHSRRDIGFSHVENAVQIAQQGNTGAQATLPHGLLLRVGYTTLTVADQKACHLPSERPWLTPGDQISVQGVLAIITDKKHSKARIPLPTNVTCSHPDKNYPWVLVTEVMRHWNRAQVFNNPNPLTAWMDADRLHNVLSDKARLHLRTRKQGDQFRPQGLGGATVRLSDFLINVKLPRAWRDHLPLLATDKEILWVVGIRLSQCTMVQPETKRVVRLRFLRRSLCASAAA